MNTRFATENDIPMLLELLSQVCLVHHIGRPDLFKNHTKYVEEDLVELLKDKDRPVIVAVDDEDKVLGYGFCMFSEYKDERHLVDFKTCYIDDICVDENARRKHVGKTVYDAIVALAKKRGCHNITLNVWAINDVAYKFYESLGMSIQKTTMETVL